MVSPRTAQDTERSRRRVKQALLRLGGKVVAGTGANEDIGARDADVDLVKSGRPRRTRSIAEDVLRVQFAADFVEGVAHR
jgi:hypothetical protein